MFVATKGDKSNHGVSQPPVATYKILVVLASGWPVESNI
jgi:hypothetical protein